MATKPIIAMSAPVEITASAQEGGKQSPPKFRSEFYTGGALNINGWEHPVVVDLTGLETGKVLVANLDHDKTKRVGNFTVDNDGKRLIADGTATAKTAAREEVIGSAADGYQWQSSLEVNPTKVEEIKAGKTVQVNGQSFTGPLYVTRKGVLKGFAFVSHGADDNTTVTIAATAAISGVKTMKAEVKAWAESMGIDTDSATPEQVEHITANYLGANGKKPAKVTASNPFEARKLEAKRRSDIREIADKFIELRGSDLSEIEALEKMHDHAIEAGMSSKDFRIEMYESAVPQGHTVSVPKRENRAINARVLEAAVCQAGRLQDIDSQFSDQELQVARDNFKDGIGLNQLFIVGAEMNGHRGISGGHVDSEILRAAFRGKERQIHAAGFSALDISSVVAATANKFLHEGWMSVDQTLLRICAIRNVKNFQQITTVSLTGALQYTKVGGDGEIKHGTMGNLTYTNQADTYAAMLAITRRDLINDDMGALTAAPKKLGRGGMLKLNDIGWTEVLVQVSANFFASGNSNINTGVADMTVGGLDATETIFMNQTDPDSKPLGIMPKILLVPTALKNKALTLMGSQGATYGTSYATAAGDANPFRGRFQVESSPYISNSSYTGYTSVGWWMLADPNECPVWEIAALNGRIEPQVDSTEADFNTLGIQLRGYCDVGVNEQEKRGGVYADGGAS